MSDAPIPVPALHPNRARLALLQDVDDGFVVYAPGQGGVLNLATSAPVTVLAEATELRRAGWVDVDFDAPSPFGHYPYVLTAIGRAELERAHR
ncbi:hypothetical protein [Micromonospora sp. DT227]|uniref:hypothetical protein n=1 Tax=Micromonospora sp. DT227 TaxID=3393433 RepID=UPI003CF97687